MLVQQILSSKPQQGVTTVAPDVSVGDAANILSSKRIGTLVVADDKTSLAGILSERDIVREIGKRGGGCLSDAVSDLMTRKIVTCTKDDTADGVLEMMTNGRFRHMPVLEGDDLIGLISIGDVVKARLSELSMEKDALEGMIMGH